MISLVTARVLVLRFPVGWLGIFLAHKRLPAMLRAKIKRLAVALHHPGGFRGIDFHAADGIAHWLGFFHGRLENIKLNGPEFECGGD